MPEMLIGGEWREAAAHEELEVVNPATEETVDSVPAGAREDVELAVATAKRAFGEWSRTDVEKRAAILTRAADLIQEHAKELAAKLTSEQGKPIAEAVGEVNHLAHGVRYYAEAATKTRGSYQELPSAFGPAYGQVIRRPTPYIDPERRAHQSAPPFDHPFSTTLQLVALQQVVHVRPDRGRIFASRRNRGKMGAQRSRPAGTGLRLIAAGRPLRLS